MTDDPDADIRIRPFEPSDCDAINEVLASTYPWTEYDSAFQVASADLAARDSMFIAVVDDRTVGFAWLVDGGAFGRSAYLKLLGVSEVYQGLGIGSALMDRVETFSGDQLGSDELFLLVSGFNSGAIEFYRDRGYEQVGLIPGYVEKGIDELIFWKRIRP